MCIKKICSDTLNKKEFDLRIFIIFNTMSIEERKIYALGKLGIALEKHFMNHFGSVNYWVTAEITKVNEKSGHYYLQLADRESNATTAQMNATIWSMQYRMIKSEVGNDLETILKSGNKALFNVKIEYHKIYGLKLNIIAIDPSYSYGEIEKRKQETIKRLQKEGLFDLQQQLYFPTLTKRIALVGSPETSGFRDFRDEIYNNSVYRRFKLKYFPTSVQGDRAQQEIISALKKARCYDVEAIVLIRGGGSKMDLDIFNDYEICKTICETKIPILTGIGHETDEVVADLVAHMNFITPTAVAKHLYVQIGNFRHFLSKYYDQIMTRSLEQIGAAKDEFQHQNKYLVHYSQDIIRTWRERFADITFSLSKQSQRLIHIQKEELSNQTYQLQSAFSSMLNQYNNELNRFVDLAGYNALRTIESQRTGNLLNLEDKIGMLAYNTIDQAKTNLNNQAEMLQLLNPEKILKSGYTISTVADEDVDRITENLVGKEMKTLSSSFLITSKIIKQEKK